jgi:ABC-type thiamine transport system substrate-binding protein
MKSVYGDDAAAAWEKLSDRVLTVTPGWSEAYGLFTSGEAPMVLSYTTSPAYHMVAEETDRYRRRNSPKATICRSRSPDCSPTRPRRIWRVSS